MSHPSDVRAQAFAGIVLTVAAWSAAVTAQRPTPLTCTSARPYEGRPVRAGRVPLPERAALGSGSFGGPIVDALDRTSATALERTGASALTAAVATADGSWRMTATADGSPLPARFYWASVGKAATATLILDLVERGKLSLRDSVSRWLPQFPQGRITTVDHLLTHTSGLFSANEDEAFRASPHYRTPDDEIRDAGRLGPLFCPGQAWRYSNTGYVALGRIIEAVEGRPYHDVVHDRIAARLGLATFRALAPRERPSDVAPFKPSAGAQAIIEPSWPFAAGAIVASADDMLRFWHALLTGRLLNAHRTASLFERLYPMFDAGTFYGRGVMLYDVPDGQLAGDVWLGHSGGTPGAKAVVAYSVSRRAFVAVALTGDGPAEAAANLLFSQLPRP